MRRIVVTRFVAFDGTEFTTERECLDYESSFVGSRLVNLLSGIFDWIEEEEEEEGDLPSEYQYGGWTWNVSSLSKEKGDRIRLDALALFLNANAKNILLLLNSAPKEKRPYKYHGSKKEQS